MAQRLRWWTWTQRAWVQLPVVPIRVIGGGRKGRTSGQNCCRAPVKSCLGRHVRALEQGSRGR